MLGNLQALPEGTAEGCREPLEYARARLPALRRLFIVTETAARSQPSDSDEPPPLVRGMAVWACGRLLEPETVRALRRQQGERETDAQVRDEWRAATGLTGSRTDETSAA